MRRSCFVVPKALDRSITTAPAKSFLAKTSFQFSISDCCKLNLFYITQTIDRYLCNHLFTFASVLRRLVKC